MAIFHCYVSSPEGTPFTPSTDVSWPEFAAKTGAWPMRLQHMSLGIAWHRLASLGIAWHRFLISEYFYVGSWWDDFELPIDRYWSLLIVIDRYWSYCWYCWLWRCCGSSPSSRISPTRCLTLWIDTCWYIICIWKAPKRQLRSPGRPSWTTNRIKRIWSS